MNEQSHFTLMSRTVPCLACVGYINRHKHPSSVLLAIHTTGKCSEFVPGSRSLSLESSPLVITIHHAKVLWTVFLLHG